jgi:hypothetical protein
MAFCRVRRVKVLHEILHGIAAVFNDGSTMEPDG